MRTIEKIDRTREYTTDEVLTAILDKVNELVDSHNEAKDIKVSVSIDENQIQSFVANVDALKSTVTTLEANEFKFNVLAKENVNIDNLILEQADVTMLNKGEI